MNRHSISFGLPLLWVPERVTSSGAVSMFVYSLEVPALYPCSCILWKFRRCIHVRVFSGADQAFPSMILQYKLQGRWLNLFFCSAWWSHWKKRNCKMQSRHNISYVQEFASRFRNNTKVLLWKKKRERPIIQRCWVYLQSVQLRSNKLSQIVALSGSKRGKGKYKWKCDWNFRLLIWLSLDTYVAAVSSVLSNRASL